MKTIILNLISESIAKENSYIKEHEQIASILKTLEGKPLTGITLSKKRLSAFDVENGYSFRFIRQYGMFYISGKYEHLIGYDNDPFVKLGESSEYGKRGFEYFDICHGSAAKERIKQLENINIDLMVKIFSEIQTTFENMRVLFGDIERNYLGSYYNPIYYDILRAIHPTPTSHGDIKLNDFYYIRK